MRLFRGRDLRQIPVTILIEFFKLAREFDDLNNAHEIYWFAIRHRDPIEFDIEHLPYIIEFAREIFDLEFIEKTKNFLGLK